MRELKIFCNHIYAGLLTEHSNKNIRFVMMMVILSILPFLPSH